MPADIKFHDNHVEIEGTAVLNGETRSTGSLAGYSFADRSAGWLAQGKGTRFVWYADKKQARLWSDGDMLTVEWNTSGQPLMKVHEIWAANITLGSVGSLKGVIDQFVISDKQLRERVSALEAQLSALKSEMRNELNDIRQKVGMGIRIGSGGGSGNGRPPPIGR